MESEHDVSQPGLKGGHQRQRDALSTLPGTPNPLHPQPLLPTLPLFLCDIHLESGQSGGASPAWPLRA